MPVEISYFPRPSSFRKPRICVSLVSRTTLADLIDVSEHLDSAFAMQQIQKLFSARTGRRCDSNERHIRGSRAAGVVHRIADVKQLLLGTKTGDLPQSIGRGL